MEIVSVVTDTSWKYDLDLILHYFILYWPNGSLVKLLQWHKLPDERYTLKWLGSESGRMLWQSLICITRVSEVIMFITRVSEVIMFSRCGFVCLIMLIMWQLNCDRMVKNLFIWSMQFHTGALCFNTYTHCQTGSTLAQVMACCLTSPSHYLNQCWFTINKVH